MKHDVSIKENYKSVDGFFFFYINVGMVKSYFYGLSNDTLYAFHSYVTSVITKPQHGVLKINNFIDYYYYYSFIILRLIIINILFHTVRLRRRTRAILFTMSKLYC